LLNGSLIIHSFGIHLLDGGMYSRRQAKQPRREAQALLPHIILEQPAKAIGDQVSGPISRAHNESPGIDHDSNMQKFPASFVTDEPGARAH
jgi:hypothetical protein